MRKGGYYVNNTLLGESGQGNEWTGEQVNCGGRQSNKGTEGIKKRRQGNIRTYWLFLCYPALCLYVTMSSLSLLCLYPLTIML